MTETEAKSDPEIMKDKHKSLTTKKILCIVVGVVLAAALLPPIVVPLGKPWTEINCRHQDINIKTGQARYSRYLWFVKISEEIKDTPISVVLEGKMVDVANVRPWHRVNTFSPGQRHSPHYNFHGAFSQAHKMETLFELIKSDREERREIAGNTLKLWQTERSYFPVDDYLQAVLERGMNLSEQR